MTILFDCLYTYIYIAIWSMDIVHNSHTHTSGCSSDVYIIKSYFVVRNVIFSSLVFNHSMLIYFFTFLPDVSHLTVTQPIPPSTTASPETTITPTNNSTTPPSDACTDVQCLNDGVCVLEQSKPVCRWIISHFYPKRRVMTHSCVVSKHHWCLLGVKQG